MSSISCCIVIPCYNEERRLHTNSFISFIESNPSFKIVFANDGSTDGTKELIETIAGRYSDNIAIYSQDKNVGKGEIVRAAILDSLKDESLKNCNYFGYWDADLATPLNEAIDFVEIFSKYPTVGLVIGARVKRLGACINRKLFKHLTGRVFATFVSNFINLPVYDSQCGTKVMTREIAEVAFKDPFVSKWIFDVELLSRAKKYLEAKDIFEGIHEHPLKVWIDVGYSKFKIIDKIIAVIQLIKMRKNL